MDDTRLESFPFDSKRAGYDDYGYPVYDRAVGASMLRQTFEQFFSDGVFGTPGDAFQISKGDGLRVNIAGGISIIKGAMASVPEGGISVQLTDEAETVGTYAYGIFLRYDENADKRSVYVQVRKGDAGTYPTPPEPDTTSPGIRELRLGYVTVPTGSTDLSSATVTNEKGLDVCPFAAPFEKIDMSGVTADAKASAQAALTALQQYIEANKSLIDSAIDGTTAGYLQSQITDLQEQLNNLDFSTMVDNETIEYTQELGEPSKLLRIREEGLQTKHYSDGSVTYQKLADDVTEAITQPQMGKDLGAYTWQEIMQLANDPANLAEDFAYMVGQTKSLKIAGYGTFFFRMIGVGQDVRSDNGQLAKMTFEIVDIPTTHRMNPSDSTTGGWGDSEMREWLNSTMLNALPDYMIGGITTVKKKYNVNGSIVTCDDKLWCLSEKELTGSITYGDEGEFYEYWASHNNSEDRIKRYNGSACNWWLRSVYNSEVFRGVNGDGDRDSFFASDTHGVVFCFCIG